MRAELAPRRGHLLRPRRHKEVSAEVQPVVPDQESRMQAVGLRGDPRRQGHHNLLRFQLLRNRIEQGGLPEADGARPVAPLRAVHDREQSYEKHDIPTASRTHRELRAEGALSENRIRQRSADEGVRELLRGRLRYGNLFFSPADRYFANNSGYLTSHFTETC